MLGSVLVAPPAQDDEFWAKTVVFIYEENQNNTVGLIVNKPSEKSLKELAEHHDLAYSGGEMLYMGGPVNPNALVMLHTDDWACTNTMQIATGFRVSSDRSMLQRICSGDTPRRWRLFLGMSAWTPRQLEGEIAGDPPWSKKRAWLTALATEQIIFGRNSDSVWKKSIDLAASQAVQNFFTIN